MKQRIASSIFRLMGWKAVFDVPNFPKCVICVAPHTSNWDFIIGKLAYLSVGRKAGFLMKKDWFFFPLGSLFRSMGGVPVYRDKKHDLTTQIANKYNESEEFAIAITPEGTRKRNSKWKKGFYYIALQANVPIVLASFDYKLKVAAASKYIYPTGDYEADMVEIKAYYKGVTAKYPELFATK